MQDSSELEKLFDELVRLRTEIARNAGFDNYRDYGHAAKGRFDYTPDDLFRFHSSIKSKVVPITRELSEKRKKDLGVEVLRPWDSAVDVDGEVLNAFDDIEEFVQKTVGILEKVKPGYGRKLSLMNQAGFLDLGTRPGKAPGGYNAALPRAGAAFVFMNAAGHNGDVTIILHEAGHAMHSFATVDEKILPYWEKPSEISELASMSMELLTLDHIGDFFPDEIHRKKATYEQLKRTLVGMPQAMVVDAFQHWIYTTPDHDHDQRNKYFHDLVTQFGDTTDWSGLEDFQAMKWLRILHIFQAPLYYIEYAISQLGAIAVYKNFKCDKEKALVDYDNFLALGYSRSLPEIYAAAGIRFDFSEDYISKLADFINKELNNT